MKVVKIEKPTLQKGKTWGDCVIHHQPIGKVFTSFPLSFLVLVFDVRCFKEINKTSGAHTIHIDWVKMPEFARTLQLNIIEIDSRV